MGQGVPFSEAEQLVVASAKACRRFDSGRRLVSVGRDGVETIAHNATVYTLSAAKATHIKTFQTKADALEVVGLSE